MRYLYMAVDGPACKIGFSNNPHRRTRELYYDSYRCRKIRDAPIVTAWPAGEAAQPIENYLKKKLKAIRRPYATEWFTISRRQMVTEIRRALKLFDAECRAIHRRRDRKGNLAGWPGYCSNKMFLPRLSQ